MVKTLTKLEIEVKIEIQNLMRLNIYNELLLLLNIDFLVLLVVFLLTELIGVVF